MSHLCLSLTGATLQENLEILQANQSFIDCYEIRIDFLSAIDSVAVAQFPSMVSAALETPLPAILTCRRPVDGGRYRESEAQRLETLLNIMELQREEHRYQYIDIEYVEGEPKAYRRLLKSAREHALQVIRSIHILEGGAPQTFSYLETLSHDSTVIPKLAVSIRGMPELLTLCRQWQSYRQDTRFRSRRAILIGMGTYGVPTRILAPLWNSFISYSAPLQGIAAAQGQLDPATLHTLYGYHSLNGETQIYGIIGHPLQHTRSPHWHNTQFRRAKCNALYLPFLCDDLPTFMELAELLSMKGISVTIPYKQQVRRYLQWSDTTVTNSGACNTLIRHQEGWYGYNTDCQGFWLPLARLLRKQDRTLPTRALIIGAGGVARAAASELLKRGCDLLILNRTPSRAEKMCQELSQHYPSRHCHSGSSRGNLPDQVKEYTALMVQSTPIGMHPNIQADPLPNYHFRGNEIVYDMIYQPRLTTLLRRAKQAGCITLGGSSMFMAQAREQSKNFMQSHC